MDIKDGYFATLYDGSVYETVSARKDRYGNYKLRSTNSDDLNNGFAQYADYKGLFIKPVSENEIEKIIRIEPYATLKNDPDENKFDIIYKREDLKKDNKLILVTTNRILAKKFGFSPFGFRSDETFKKVVSESDVDINYKEKDIFFNTSKDAYHLNTKEALEPMGLTVPTHSSQEQTLTKHDRIALAL